MTSPNTPPPLTLFFLAQIFSKCNVILTFFYVTFLLSCLVCVSWSVFWYLASNTCCSHRESIYHRYFPLSLYEIELLGIDQSNISILSSYTLNIWRDIKISGDACETSHRSLVKTESCWKEDSRNSSVALFTATSQVSTWYRLCASGRCVGVRRAMAL